jgi:enoyl-CoA hydratase
VSTTTLEIHGSIALLSLDDPDRRNVLTEEMVGEIVGHVAAAESDERVGSLVVTGRGRAFCAGADLKTLLDGGPEDFVNIYEAFLAVARCTLPTVAAVNGPAVGAGLNLALACDVRLVGERARFVARFPTIGLHPGGGHTWMLTRAVGPEVAAGMLLFGVELDAGEAVARGLGLRVCTDDELIPAALALGERAAEVPRPLAMRIKQTLRSLPGVDSHDDALGLELDAQMWSRDQPFFRERLEGFRSN